MKKRGQGERAEKSAERTRFHWYGPGVAPARAHLLIQSTVLFMNVCIGILLLWSRMLGKITNQQDVVP